MKYRTLSRSDFASLLSDEEARKLPIASFFRPGTPERSPMKAELHACWDEERATEGELPGLVLVPDEELSDFLAWAVTFLPMFRPLTSFLRVIPWTLFSLVQDRKPAANVEQGTVLVGTILGEALANATNRGFIDSLPLTALESTFSWVMSRGLAVGLNPKALAYVSGGWNAMRDLGGQSNRRIAGEPVESVWSVLLRLASNKDGGTGHARRDDPLGLIEEACLEIRRSGRISSFNWDRLSGGRISNSSIADAMNSTKERRVEIFESAVEQLLTTRAEKSSTSFLVGYLASLVSGGSLEHAHLIFPLQGELPSAMLWYGLCAGLLPDRCILRDYNHLGLRLLRLLQCKADLTSPPHCDISLAELEIILRGEPRSRGFRQSHSSSLRVELAPMVTVVMRPPPRAPGAAPDQLGLFGAQERPISLENDRLRELVISLRSTLSLAESLLNSKGASLGSQPSQYRGKRRR